LERLCCSRVTKINESCSSLILLLATISVVDPSALLMRNQAMLKEG
jgi:hypothetical protein